ncbi:MAG: tRNA (N(6)-L-threonylcarbamoyladenosine(37)-C(2))-methylthiotransferase MtaB [Candidatus Omnitrophica bacterium]|nr:tRNA (N(6)-L-threonylcarbamoyladenosine(37)-C(2))-methylthiotransferase MtaB [Candidatus Omnitrophota bacterium]
MKNVKFFTLGCKVIQYETQLMRERFERMGIQESGDQGENAGLVVVNTCTVTSGADRKSRYLIQRARRLYPRARIIVTGCYAQLDHEQLSRIEGVSLVVKNEDKPRILELLGYSGDTCQPSGAQGIGGFESRTRAFIKIQDGCNNRCAYCKIPLVRGPSKSRDAQEIVREAAALTRKGFKEIVLCGICLGSYGKDLPSKTSLAQVLGRIEALEGLLRIRLSSIEAGDVSDELIGVVARSKKICPHFHIPMQSGDGEVLKRMNRRYTPADYLAVVRKIRRAIPEAAVTTDIICGFPGEDEASFARTLEFLRLVSPSRTHIFPYSPRKGTAAESYRGRITGVSLKKRITLLEEAAEESALLYKKSFLGKALPVLIEEEAEGRPARWEGYSHTYIKVRVPGDAGLKNRLVMARVTSVTKDYAAADCISVDS